MTYTFTATNIGTIRLRNITATIPTVNDLSCTANNSPFIVDSLLELDAAFVCTGTYTYMQHDLEAADKNSRVTAEVKAATGNFTFQSNEVVVTPQNNPAMTIDILTAECIVPTKACKLHATGTSTSALQHLLFTVQAVYTFLQHYL